MVLFNNGVASSVDAGEVSGPGLRLLVYPDTEKSGKPCDVPKCTVSFGQTFRIGVITNPSPAGGFSAYRIVFQYSGDFNLKQQEGLAENRAPNCNLGYEQNLDCVYVLSCKLASTFSELVQYNGPLANVPFNCKNAQGSITLLAGPGGSLYTVPGCVNPVVVPIR